MHIQKDILIDYDKLLCMIINFTESYPVARFQKAWNGGHNQFQIV